MLSEVADKARIRPNESDGGLWDADALFTKFTAKGAVVAYPPVDRGLYDNREFAIRDLDGYMIASAHDIAVRPPAAG
jgi:hypothetical protein